MPEQRQLYAILMKLTAAGAQDIEATLEAVNATRAGALVPLGITEESFLVTMGGFDLITIVQAADAGVAAFYALELAKSGLVTTETVTAFAPDDFTASYAHNKVTRGS